MATYHRAGSQATPDQRLRPERARSKQRSFPPSLVAVSITAVILFYFPPAWHRSYRRSGSCGTIVLSVAAKDDIVDDEDSARYGHDQALHPHQVLRHVQDANHDDGVQL